MTAPDDSLGRVAYQAYGDSTGGLTHQGEPMPAWEGLGDTIQAAWIAAAGEIKHVVTGPGGEPVVIRYRNHRDEVADRRILPRRIWFGSTDWHPEPQWLMDATDVDRGVERSFALRDVRGFDEAWRRALDALAEAYAAGWHDSRKGLANS